MLALALLRQAAREPRFLRGPHSTRRAPGDLVSASHTDLLYWRQMQVEAPGPWAGPPPRS